MKLNGNTKNHYQFSAYLRLNSTPQPYHTDDLTDGQIWISLPPPLSTEDSIVVAWYRVICSTDSILTQRVSCYNNLVSVSTREVLITLPDTTKPFYTAIQVVRNFNGEELLDDAYSPVSDLFCTGIVQLIVIVFFVNQKFAYIQLNHLL